MRTIRYGATIALAIAAAGSFPAFARAQDAGDKKQEPARVGGGGGDKERLDSLEKKINEQQKEIEDLRRKQATTPEGKKDVPGGATTQPIEQKPEDARLEWGYDEGFVVKGRIGDEPFSIRPSARLQLDYRLYGGANTQPNDQFLMRRARVGFIGEFAHFVFQLDVDPVHGGIPLGDFWFQWQQFEELKIRFGHYKTPFTNEDGMTSDLHIDCIERPMVIGSGAEVAPDFHPGAEVFGRVADGLFNYWISVQNQLDSNNQVTSNPLYCGRVGSDVGGLSIGAAAIFDRRVGGKNEVSFPGLTPGQFQWFKPVPVRGWTQRFEADAAYYFGPIWGKLEYVYAMQARDHITTPNGQTGAPIVTQGITATFGMVIWGPKKDSARPHVVPFKGWELFSFDVEKRANKNACGLELVVRPEWMKIGRRAPNSMGVTGVAPNIVPVDGGQVYAITTGLNFAPIENVKFMIDWVHLHFSNADQEERPLARNAEEFLFRAQLDF